MASGQVSGSTLAPAIEAAEKERSRLLAQSEQRHEREVATVERLVTDAVERYREIVGQLRDAHRLLPPADFIEARGLVHELLGGPVPVRQRAKDGRTVLAITLDPAPLFRATGSIADNVVAEARVGNYLPPSPAGDVTTGRNKNPGARPGFLKVVAGAGFEPATFGL